MKKTPAIIAAFIMTVVIGLGMLLIGANALFTPDSVAQAGAPGSADGSAALASAEQVQQLQSLVAQYQEREKQYQQQLDQAKQTLNQANTQLQQYQQVLQALQQRGLITINRDGSISIPRTATNRGSGGDR